MFVIYYGFATWCVCDEAGNLLKAGCSKFECDRQMQSIANEVVWC